MEDAPKVKARLESLRGLGDLVGALRAMAASHAKDAQAAFEGARRYSAVVERAIAAAARMEDAGAPPPPSGTRRVLVTVCSEHGFVGGFNRQLLERTAAELAEGEELEVIGRRGALRAAESGLRVARERPMTSRISGVPPLARRIAAGLRDAASARVLFAAYRTGAGFDVTLRPLLPPPPPPPETERREPPLRHLGAAALRQRLAGEYLFAELARALMDSLAAENGARLRTMEAASRNISDKLDKLSREAREIRQRQITADLIDVVTGAEAVRNGEEG